MRGRSPAVGVHPPSRCLAPWLRALVAALAEDRAGELQWDEGTDADEEATAFSGEGVDPALVGARLHGLGKRDAGVEGFGPSYPLPRFTLLQGEIADDRHDSEEAARAPEPSLSHLMPPVEAR